MIIKTKEEILKIIEACRSVDSEMLESEEVEFKEFASIKSLHGSRDLAEELSALANKNGGVVIVGIKDGNNVVNSVWETQLVGFEVGDLIEIEQRLKGKLKPSIEIKAEYVQFENKNYLIIHVPMRRDTLITTSSGKVCIRDGRSSRPMSPEEIKSAIGGLHNYDWTAEVLESLDMSSLNEKSFNEAYDDYCKRKKYTLDELPTYRAFLEAIGATSNGNLTKSGLLFLGKSETIKKWLGVYEYRFSWKTRSGQLLINEVWDDNLWNTILKSKSNFTICNSEHDITFKNTTYKCKTLDSKAFHEGFMNALVHRDYSIEGMVVVDFNSGRMTITNPGVFYGGVSAENIIVHQPRHRNKALAKLLMSFHLVDRAGMGVQRMGLGSLMYGREFPSFRESFDTVEVIMSAASILPGIFALTQNEPDKFGVIDLIIFNSIYRNGATSVASISHRMKGLTHDVWPAITDAVKRHSQIELCGTKEGVFIRVIPKWNSFFDVKKSFKIPSTSEKHVDVYDYLREFHEASNEDITKLLKHKNATHTSKFLKDATYTKRVGNGPKARWSLA
jgi:predicted HTH transcriptional regulator